MHCSSQGRTTGVTNRQRRPREMDVAQVMIDELNEADEAFAGNRLLSTFNSDARGLIEPAGVLIQLASGDVVLDRGAEVESSLFPVGPTMISMGVELSGGRSVEVASIGREGAVGGIVSCGHAPAFSRGRSAGRRAGLQGPDESARGSQDPVALHRGNLFCRFSDYLLSQVMQSAACNSLPFDPRARGAVAAPRPGPCRRPDRAHPGGVPGLLGVQRTTVNAVIRTLQDEGLVTSGAA